MDEQNAFGLLLYGYIIKKKVENLMRLLIVEDDYMTLEGIVKVINWQEIGITQLEKAEDGMDAIELAKKFHPNIVLSDIRMPRIGGLEFAEKLQVFNPSCKVIFMSAYTDREYYKEAIKLKAMNFIEKPIDVNELEKAIVDAVTMCREESIKRDHLIEVDQTLQSSLPFIKSELAMLLIKKDADKAEVAKMQKLLCLDMQENSDFATIIIKMQNTTFEEHPYDSKILTCIEDIIYQNDYCGIVAFRDTEHIFLHIGTTKDKKYLMTQSKLENLCSLIYKALENSLCISIVIGAIVNGIFNINKSYSTAILAQQTTFYENKCISPYHTLNNSSPYLFDKKKIGAFSDYLTRKDMDKLILLIKQLSDELRTHPNTSVNAVKTFYFQMLMQLFKIAEREGIQLFDPDIKEGLLWDMISGYCFLSDIERLIINKIKTYFTLLEEKNQYSIIVTNILDYIHAHYHEQTLSTNDISKHVYLSSAYICVVFKQELSETIGQYITKFRIETSKIMLEDLSYKISDIARKVGYHEGDYFTKVFKKIEGVTPSKFRERLMS